MYSLKLSGRTAASVDGTATGIIATLAVSYDTDGVVRWVDSSGKTRTLSISNDASGDLASLLRTLFTGTGGLDAGSAGVQGHRVFGEPVILQ